MVPYESILGSGKFAHGMVRYSDHYLAERRTARIVIPVTLGDRLSTLALVDTGSPLCVLNPEEARSLDIDYTKESIPIGEFTMLGWKGPSWNCQIPVGIKAGEGEDITLSAAVFIPQLYPSHEWLFPNLLGFSGFLSRIRVAVDPEGNLCYFGALGEAAG